MNNNKPNTLDDELLNIIASQVKVTPYTIVMSMGIVAYMMYLHLPERPLLWGGWMALVVLSQLYRMLRLSRLPELTHIPAKRRTREAAVINLVSTGIMSLSLLAFPLFTPFEAGVQTIAFVSFGVGSIVTAVGWAPYTLGHIWLTLVPLFGLWTWSGLVGNGGTLATCIAVVGFCYSLTMWLIGRRLFEMNRQFFAGRAALSAALDEAETAAVAKSRFLAAASHDLRQPIHTLALFSGALGMSSLDRETRDISHHIRGAVKALSSQLDALLDVSKLDAGIVPVNATGTDLTAFVDRLCQEYRSTAETVGITIRAETPPRAMAFTDPALLERVVRNILTNAITHNANCEVTLSVTRQRGHWRFTIADNGTGIPPDYHRQVFEEFYQVPDSAGERSRGLGLGLSIVRRLAALLKIDMQFESEPGLGTRFHFRIPLDAHRAPASGDRGAAVGPPRDTRVLVVDDEPSVREGMRVLLELMGCRVDLADSMEAALSSVGQSRPDIILVDYHLRGRHNGREVIDDLRRVHPGLPAILISGDTGPERLQEAHSANISLLSKPVASEALCAAMVSALQGTSGIAVDA